MIKLMRWFSPSKAVKLMSIWPPFLATGIRVSKVDKDFRHITVELRDYIFNRNYVGTHFGGSIYSMTDPFFMLMYLHHLGKSHIIWDQAASVEFLKPGRGTLSAKFHLSQEDIHQAQSRCSNEFSIRVSHSCKVTDRNGEIIAKVHKTIYLRSKTAKSTL